MSDVTIPRVLVLLAAYNGMQYFEQQIRSILTQQNCYVTLLISVDVSSDQTHALALALAKQHASIQVLPYGEVFGRAAANFYHLLRHANLDQIDYIAYSDQDDLWHADKLARHVNIAKEMKADAVSSDVVAFWPNGKRKYIRKSYQQKKYDYLFESAGPGCTFLMSTWLVSTMKQLLSDKANLANSVTLHDWLTYAVCRAHQKTWVIDDSASLDYRQHHSNVVGANSGLKAYWSRVSLIKSGWYKQEIIKVTSICSGITNDPFYDQLLCLLNKKSLLAKLSLIYLSPSFRRNMKDQLFFVACVTLGIFR